MKRKTKLDRYWNWYPPTVGVMHLLPVLIMDVQMIYSPLAAVVMAINVIKAVGGRRYR